MVAAAALKTHWKNQNSHLSLAPLPGEGASDKWEFWFQILYNPAPTSALREGPVGRTAAASQMIAVVGCLRTARRGTASTSQEARNHGQRLPERAKWSLPMKPPWSGLNAKPYPRNHRTMRRVLVVVPQRGKTTTLFCPCLESAVKVYSETKNCSQEGIGAHCCLARGGCKQLISGSPGIKFETSGKKNQIVKHNICLI
jgi:hypothetical protein